MEPFTASRWAVKAAGASRRTYILLVSEQEFCSTPCTLHSLLPTSGTENLYLFAGKPETNSMVFYFVLRTGCQMDICGFHRSQSWMKAVEFRTVAGVSTPNRPKS